MVFITTYICLHTHLISCLYLWPWCKSIHMSARDSCPLTPSDAFVQRLNFNMHVYQTCDQHTKISPWSYIIQPFTLFSWTWYNTMWYKAKFQNHYTCKHIFFIFKKDLILFIMWNYGLYTQSQGIFRHFYDIFYKESITATHLIKTY